MSLLEKVLARERGETGQPLDWTERAYQYLIEPAADEIAGDLKKTGARVNYIDKAIGESAFVGKLRSLMSSRAEAVLEPMNLVFNERGDVPSPFVEDAARKGRIYTVLYDNNHSSKVMGGAGVGSGVKLDWRFTTATAEAAAMPQFYQNEVYVFHPDNPLGTDHDAILSKLEGEMGADAEVVRDIRSLIGLARGIINKRVYSHEDSQVLDQMAALVSKHGKMARAVINSVEEHYHA